MVGSISRLVGLFFLVALALIVLLTAVGQRATHAATLTYPGSPPCDTTLQACIDGAAPGDTVEIATNSPVDENIAIAKSLTLTAADGFNPVIGGGATARRVDVRDAGEGGGPVTIVLHRLILSNAQVTPFFRDDSGHSFVLTDSSVSYNPDTNSDSAVRASANAPSTFLIRNNVISSSGDGIALFTNLEDGAASFTVMGNRLTTGKPPESQTGIKVDFRFGAGTATVNLYSNVIYGVGDCNCGAPSGIRVRTLESVDATVSIINNTIDDVQSPGNGTGIKIDEPEDSSLLTANIFNNVVTRASGAGIWLPRATGQLSVNNGYNDFYDNALPNQFGGYTPGPSTLNVDPMYVNPNPPIIALAAQPVPVPITGFDFHLKQGSPVIDAGTGNPAGGLPDLDADGNLRIAGTTVDMGAYEFNSVAPTPTPTPTVTSTPTQTPPGMQTPTSPNATPLPAGMESVPLVADVCNPVTSTYPDDTTPTTVADAVSPSGILGGLWGFEGGTWLGFSPQFPDVSDLTNVEFLQVVSICVTLDGSFARPIV